MGKEELERIKKKFKELELHPEYLEHKEVITSQDAAETRGFELKQGIKALLFTNGEEFIVVDLPADKRVDSKKLTSQTGWSRNKTRMATPEEVLEKTGCEIGAVPPFGHKINMPILVDKGVYNNQISTFNIGLRTDSVKIPTKEMKEVFDSINAVEGDFSQ
jgi:prolyl-tRNA editing enzyme YbaK/EbsC (Cys-tRNA(Pro) deacylase)